MLYNNIIPKWLIRHHSDEVFVGYICRYITCNRTGDKFSSGLDTRQLSGEKHYETMYFIRVSVHIYQTSYLIGIVESSKHSTWPTRTTSIWPIPVYMPCSRGPDRAKLVISNYRVTVRLLFAIVL